MTRAHIPAAHALRTSVRENRLSDPERITNADYVEHLEGLGQGWIAERDGTMLGVAIANGVEGSVWGLFVAPDAEGRGIGRTLHDAMVAWLFARGHATLTLATEAGTRAERLYSRAGWTCVGPGDGNELRFRLERPRERGDAQATPTD